MLGRDELDVTNHPRRRRIIAGVIGLLVAGSVFAAPVARSQVPGLPPLDVPPEIQALLDTAQDEVIPVLVDVANEAHVATNAVGFALRGPCGSIGTAVLLAALVGGGLPVSPGFVSTPVLILCAGAHAPGPVDPIFQTADECVGPHVAEAAQPVLDEVTAELEPVHAELGDVCGTVSLVGFPEVPPPLDRFDYLNILCG